MRHLGSLVLSLFLATTGWLLTGFGLVGYGPEWLGPLLLLPAGLCYALLVLPRLSPIGPGLVGLGFLGAAGWAMIDHSSWRASLPESFLGVDEVLTAPAEPFAALLAVPLLLTVLQPRRWRRYERVAALYAEPPPGQSSYPPAYPAPYPHGQPGHSGHPGQSSSGTEETTLRLDRY